MKPLDLSEINSTENKIPSKYIELVNNYKTDLIAGSIVIWEDQMFNNQIYIGLYDKELVIFATEDMFHENHVVSIPLENIVNIHASRARGFTKKNKVYEIEIVWNLTEEFNIGYESRKEQSQLNIIDVMLGSSASAIEKMMGIQNSPATLLVGEIKGTGKYDSFGYLAVKLLEKSDQFNLII